MEEQVKTDPLTLTTLANELLIDVFQTLPQANLKVLYAVCRKLRDFIKNNGSFICKMRVVPHYQDAIALLGLEKDTLGWYLPSDKLFLDIEGCACTNLVACNTHTYYIDGRVFLLEDTEYVKYLQQVDLLLLGP
ncbi:hypothetical protein IFR04_007755 [Cadophora malorum]|uniref:F-box domain-containing protein n=1 Tax=Cadophora malorum TaxID=108018 RepID=A0A8H7WAW5_9HELO|nr:hypothetical protein IFR04_007755 [Cadophora malorum]